MCFSIPLKVLKTSGKTAQVEGGTSVRLGNEIVTKPGDYLQVVGTIAVRSLSQHEGKKIRTIIAELNSPYVG